MLVRTVAIGIVVALLAAGPVEARRGPPLTTPSAIARARHWAIGRAGNPSFAVVGERGRIRGLHRARTYPAASVTKAMLMVAVLRSARHRRLSGSERGLLNPMITLSDNDAARALFARYGSLGLDRVAHAARMRHFTSRGALFEARIAAGDQARFFARIDRLVPRRHRRYARYLLRSIVSYERWGIPPAARAHHLRVFFKGGWRSHITHQVALLERSKRHRVALAVLTESPSMAYGEATIEGIARRVLSPPFRLRARYRRPRRIAIAGLADAGGSLSVSQR
jgi:hypothetical protein